MLQNSANLATFLNKSNFVICWQNYSNLKKSGFRAVQKSALCRSLRELSNAYLVTKFGFDTAENEPCNACPIPRGEVPRPMCCSAEQGLGRLQALAQGGALRLGVRGAALQRTSAGLPRMYIWQKL